MTHPWRDVELPPDDLLHEFPAVIEIPKGSKVKYAVDEATGVLRVESVLFSSMHYPANYGIIPRTLASSGAAPLDVLVLCQEPVVPLALMTARAIGGFRMTNGNGPNDKIICVHVHDPAFSDYRRTEELPEHVTAEMMHFFEDYKAHEGMLAHVGERFDAEEAAEVVRHSARRYRDRFRPRRRFEPETATTFG